LQCLKMASRFLTGLSQRALSPARSVEYPQADACRLVRACAFAAISACSVDSSSYLQTGQNCAHWTSDGTLPLKIGRSVPGPEHLGASLINGVKRYQEKQLSMSSLRLHHVGSLDGEMTGKGQQSPTGPLQPCPISGATRMWSRKKTKHLMCPVGRQAIISQVLNLNLCCVSRLC
jgi:hypothetical protein